MRTNNHRPSFTLTSTLGHLGHLGHVFQVADEMSAVTYMVIILISSPFNNSWPITPSRHCDPRIEAIFHWVICTISMTQQMTQFSPPKVRAFFRIDFRSKSWVILGHPIESMTQRTETEQNGNLFGLGHFPYWGTLKLKSCCTGLRIGFRG